MKTRVVPRFGDVVEIRTPNGLAYVQYTAKHTMPPVFGDLVRVLPGLYETRPDDFSLLAQTKHSYFTFTPISVACRRRLATIVCHEKVPEWAQGIPVMRMANQFDGNGKPQDWYLWDGVDTWPVTGPADEATKLSIAAIWGHDFLIEKLAEGWRPSDEPVGYEGSPAPKPKIPANNLRDRVMDEIIGLESDADERDVIHHMYFTSDASAKEATNSLTAAGFSAVVKPRHHENTWLVEVITRVQLDEEMMRDTMSYLQRFATSRGGEYDGWYVSVK